MKLLLLILLLIDYLPNSIETEERHPDPSTILGIEEEEEEVSLYTLSQLLVNFMKLVSNCLVISSIYYHYYKKQITHSSQVEL